MYTQRSEHGGPLRYLHLRLRLRHHHNRHLTLSLSLIPNLLLNTYLNPVFSTNASGQLRMQRRNIRLLERMIISLKRISRSYGKVTGGEWTYRERNVRRRRANARWMTRRIMKLKNLDGRQSKVYGAGTSQAPYEAGEDKHEKSP